jgi:hypothetical protein
MTDEIDDLVRAAAHAHEALVPADHFDGLSARVMARLARPDEEVAMMSETNKDAPRGATPPQTSVGPAGTPERTDDSGVHDMKALAQTAKQRISRRITSQHDAYDESLISSSQSGLRAVALPVQAQVVSLEMPSSLPGASAIAGAEAAGITPIEAARGKKSKAIWFIAAGGVIAAAAAAAFVISSGAKKKDDGALAQASAGSGPADVVAMKDSVAPSAAAGVASGSAAAVETGAVETGSSSGSAATTVVAIDPTAGSAAPPSEAPADGADKAAATAGGEQHKTHDAHPPKAESRNSGGAGSARAGAGAGAGSSKGKNDGKATGAGGGGGGGGGVAAGGGDSMEELLAAASGGAQHPTQGLDTGPAKPAKESLDSKDIRTGMGAVAKQAQACYDNYGIAGHVKIKATVEPSGKVTKAEATGEFAGTPTGTCVANAAKSASFPAWSGAPMTISYGFTLIE